MRKFSRFVDAWLMPKATNKADAIIAVSRSTEKDLNAEIRNIHTKISVVYEGIPTLSNKNVNKGSSITNFRNSYVLFVGTLEPRKNLRRLLEAYSMLPKDIQYEYNFVIAGGAGWGNDKVQDIIYELGIEKFVIVLGYVRNEDLRELYKKCSLFTMPSLYEGFGLPLLEAMSLGVPVLTSNISSMPEVTSNAAILVDPMSTISIKNGLEKILLDSELREKISLKGKIQSKNFSWDKSAKDTLNIFERALVEHKITRS